MPSISSTSRAPTTAATPTVTIPGDLQPPSELLQVRARPDSHSSTSLLPGWDDDWEKVSSVFSPSPPSKLDIKWENSRLVRPGDRIPVTVMEERPTQLRWTAERGALYTVMLMDAGQISSSLHFFK